MIHRDLTTLRIHALTLACTLGISLSLLGCGEGEISEPTVTPDDPIAAYEALSSQLDVCEREYAACTAAANGNADAIARCGSAAVSCKQRAAPADARAKESVRRGARDCRDEDDAGVVDDDAGPGGGDMHGCIERRFPNLRTCVRELIVCLDAASLPRRDAERDAIEGCVDGAHACFIAELSAWREWRRNQNSGQAGTGSSGTGGAASTAGMNGAGAGGGGSSGSGDGDDEADRGERGRRDWSPFDRRRQRRGRSD